MQQKPTFSRKVEKQKMSGRHTAPYQAQPCPIMTTHKHALPPGLCGDNLLTSAGVFLQPNTWQVLTTKPKQPTHINIQQNTTSDRILTMRRYKEDAQENPRINRQDRQKDSGPSFRRSARVNTNPNPDPRNGGPPEWRTPGMADPRNGGPPEWGPVRTEVSSQFVP